MGVKNNQLKKTVKKNLNFNNVNLKLISNKN